MRYLALLLVCLMAVCLLQSCCLTRPNFRHVQYCSQPSKASSRPRYGVIPNPCSRVYYPGYYAVDFNCVERLEKLTALRHRGIGVIILGDRLRFILPADKVFMPNSVELSPCFATTIADIADVIKMLPCVPIFITGHTDDVGRKCAKFYHSTEMARIVATHLWAQGMGWDRLCYAGRADCDQIASDLSVFGSTDNRRVEIRLDFSGNHKNNCQFNNNYCPDCLSNISRNPD